ncbi:uncharacterized protein [Taeniopygia guttata]|uniref:uncharacterized protein isoform X2 n=1 Tax=Taeniopygia guttata TaxID=59729 RepID=UPI003BB8EED8
MGQCHWLKLLFLIPGPSSPPCLWVAEQLQHTRPFPWPPAWQRSAGRWTGCGRMSPAPLLLLSLASCSLLQGKPVLKLSPQSRGALAAGQEEAQGHLSDLLKVPVKRRGPSGHQGMLLRPQRVRLEAQNFHVRLHWEPDPSLPSSATYEVEWRNRTSNWTKAGACGENSRNSWGCELHFDRIHDIYWARVRVVAGAIVGPPKLSLLLQDQILSVNITTPLTPYKRRTGSYKRVNQVLLKLGYWLHLYEGELLVQQAPCRRRSEEVPCSFEHLKASTQYCVRTAAVGIARERSREAEQCLLTPAAPSGFPWLPAALSAFFLLLLLSVAGFCIMWLHIFPNSPQTCLPKALALQNMSVTMQLPPLQLEEDPLAQLLQTALPSHGPPTAVQAPATVPRLLRGLAQGVSGYCANGFGPNCTEGREPSCTHSQLGPAVASQLPSQLEEDEEAGDGDDLPEQLVLVGLAGHSYRGDRDRQIPELRQPLHLQLYSKCQCPVLGAGSHLPLPVPSRSCRQEYLQESLGTAGHWIRLSSVKLLAGVEAEGEQHLCAPQTLRGDRTEPEQGDSTAQRGCSEQAEPEPCPSCPSQLPPSPLRPVASSGYEPRAPIGQ